MMLLSLREHEIDVKSIMEISHFQVFLSVIIIQKIIMRTNYVLLFAVIAVVILLQDK